MTMIDRYVLEKDNCVHFDGAVVVGQGYNPLPNELRELVRRANLFDDLLATAKDLLGDRPDIQDCRCVRCGRDYSGEDVGPFCPDDDCPAHMARAVIARAEAPPIKHPLPVDTRIRSIRGGDQGDWDEDEDGDGSIIERRAAPGETARIVYRNRGDDGWVYGVVFDACNAWIHLDEDEINDPNQYEVLK